MSAKSQSSNQNMDLHHPILREFPEYRDVIRRLKGSDNHFRTMFDEYHRLDDAVYRIEEEIDFATDQEIQAMKTPNPKSPKQSHIPLSKNPRIKQRGRPLDAVVAASCSEAKVRVAAKSQISNSKLRGLHWRFKCVKNFGFYRTTDENCIAQLR